jgi:hypothetical protein
MKKSLLILFLGLCIGAFLMHLIGQNKGKEAQTKYIELKENFLLDNGIVLKKGTFLRFDKTLSEGFKRYILYVNYKSDATIESKDYMLENLVKPYWMYRDSIGAK